MKSTRPQGETTRTTPSPHAPHSTLAAPPIRVGLISLGCAKNLVDAEIMLGSLLKSGVELTNDPGQADVVIVNTCSFIDSAQEESVDAILESDEIRGKTKPGQGLIVSGCLPQRFRDELPQLLPEVDAFMGIDQVAQVGDIVRQALVHRQQRLGARAVVPKRQAGVKKKIAKKFAELDRAHPHDHHEAHHDEPKAPASSHSALSTPHSALPTPLVQVNLRPAYIPDYATPRFRLTPKHFAYVKIAEGCNHPCSFCIIPRMRGAHRSRPQTDIIQEAKQLLAEGVRELDLISQDSTYYGLDLRPHHSRAISSPEKFSAAAKSLPAGAANLGTLLRELNALRGDFWIRLLYTHPAHWTGDLIRTIAECSKVARYVDIPLQHIHDNMLERMRRETSRQYIVDLLKEIRAGIPGIALRTTFIVGFPGETEEAFETLLEFIRETRFERLGVFTYSQQDGTRAGHMQDQVSDAIKRRRQRQAMEEQLKVARQVSDSFVGRQIKVLVERPAQTRDLENAKVSSWEHGLIRAGHHEEHLQRGKFMVARGEADAPDIDGRVYVRGALPAGQFATVKVVGHTDYDLIAK